MSGGGVKATYYLLLSSDFYNIFSLNSQRMIARIIECGHEIGLHFDEKKYRELNKLNMEEEIYSECKILEKMLQVSIRTVSMHRPSRETLEADYQLKGIENSYSKVFFQNFRYISDSRMNWREDVEKIIQEGEDKRLHILLHPFWYGWKERPAGVVLREFIKRATMERYQILEDNIRDLNEFVEPAELEVEI